MDFEFKTCHDKQTRQIVEKIEEGCAKLEEKRGTNIILLLMAEGWASIERETVDDIYLHLKHRNIDRDNIDVIIHSTGGDADAAYHMGIILDSKVKNGQLNFLVPRMAKSAATLLACSGNSILMTDVSELGPIDPQVETRTGRWISVTTVRDAMEEVFKMLESRRNLSDKCLDALFRTLPITEVGQFSKLTEYAKDLLSRTLLRRMRQKKDDVTKICDRLTTGYKYHGIPITRDEAREIGLEIRSLSSEEEEILMNGIYSPFRQLIKKAEEALLPILSVLPIPIVTAKKLESKFGLIYMPPINLLEKQI